MNIRVVRRALTVAFLLMAFVVVGNAAAQTKKRIIIVVPDPGLYVYPGSFPCVNGPGFCRRYKIIVVEAAQAANTFNYTAGGSVQAAANTAGGEAWIADINGNEIADDLLPTTDDEIIPTFMIAAQDHELK